MPDGADTTRDMVAAAFKEVSSRGSDSAPATETPASSPAAPAADAAPSTAPDGERGPGRDDKGRFAPKPAEPKKPSTSAATPVAGQGGAVPIPAPGPGAAPPALPTSAPDALKPPQNLRAAAREKWGTLPREMQEEFVRLQHESSRTLAESTATRKAWESHQQVISPYEGMIRAEGLEPAQAVGLLLQREAALRTAPMATKAAIIAHGIRTFLGTDEQAIKLLADALDAKGGQPGPQPPQQFDPNQIIAQAEQRLMQRLETARTQSLEQSTAAEIEQFSRTHEYMDERGPGSVADLVAYVLESHVQQNIARKEAGEDELPPLSTEQAYEQALRMHPKTAPIVAQREAAKAAAAKAATSQAARAASSGMRSEPAGPANGKPKDVRESVAQAYYAQKNAR